MTAGKYIRILCTVIVTPLLGGREVLQHQPVFIQASCHQPVFWQESMYRHVFEPHSSGALSSYVAPVAGSPVVSGRTWRPLISRYSKLFDTMNLMSFHIFYVSFGASNTLFFGHNVTLLLQNSASSASKIICRKYKNNFEHLLILS